MSFWTCIYCGREAETVDGNIRKCLSCANIFTKTESQQIKDNKIKEKLDNLGKQILGEKK